jgi:glucose/arabinose dehydrogenase
MYRVTFVVLFSFIIISSLQAQYALQEVFSTTSFNNPLEMTDPEDGTDRIFVVCQRGQIYVMNTVNPSAPGKLFLDVSDLVPQSGLEPGLLGLAFHPGYENNRYFYVYYSLTSPTRSVIARYETSPTNPDSALKSSELRILIDTMQTASHFGGKIAFGADSLLYISFGMGAGQNDPPNNAQNLSLLRGKILRINIDTQSGGNNYSIPKDNPFYDSTGNQRKEIYAWGFRNVWKFCFDSNNKLIAGDVGQNTYEEVDIVERGKNYGWRIMEGTNCFNPNPCDTTGLVLPIFQYPRSLGVSITGGYQVTSATLPSLFGKYLYGDYGSGRIWALSYNTLPVSSDELMDSPYQVSSFGKDRSGNIYVCDIGGDNIYRLYDNTVGVSAVGSFVPLEYALQQNYPNPFNPATKIRYSIPFAGDVNISIFDNSGKQAALLVSKYQTAGNYEVTWNAGSLASGIYYCRMTSGKHTLVRKLILIK